VGGPFPTIGKPVAAIPDVHTILRCALILAFCGYTPAKLKQFHKVDDHFYRGRQPGKADFPTLAHMGIHTVLDLRGGWIHKPREKRYAEAAGMQYISIRLSGLLPPRDEQIARILAVMEDPNRWPIFIHCRRGDDRLGLVIACYHIAHDHWTNRQALDDARHLGLNRFEFLMQAYILKFNPNRLPGITAPAAQTESARRYGWLHYEKGPALTAGPFEARRHTLPPYRRRWREQVTWLVYDFFRSVLSIALYSIYRKERTPLQPACVHDRILWLQVDLNTIAFVAAGGDRQFGRSGIHGKR